MLSLPGDKEAEIIEAFNSTTRYSDDLLNIDNICFDSMVSQIYLSELQLNKANSSDTEDPFLDLHLTISDGLTLWFWLWYCKFSILKWRYSSCYILRGLYRFARVASHVADFNTRNKFLTAKLLNQGYWYHTLCKAFLKFYRRHYDLVSQFKP